MAEPTPYPRPTPEPFPRSFPAVFPAVATVTTVDSWDDGDISEYGGDTASFSVQTATVVDGTHALEYNDDGALQIVSETGLDAYPSQGDTFRCRSRIDVEADLSNMFIAWATGADVLQNSYYTEKEGSTADDYSLNKRDGGTATELANVNHTFTEDIWYDDEID